MEKRNGREVDLLKLKWGSGGMPGRARVRKGQR